MLDFVSFLSDKSVANFFLLFVRISAIFVFYPFFNSAVISPQIKAAISFYITLIFYPILPELSFELSTSTLFTAVLSEILFVFFTGLILQLVFAALQFAGEQIAYIMGFSMATTVDPNSQVSTPILSQFLNSLALLVFLAFDGHHILLSYLGKTLTILPVGSFVAGQNIIDLILKGTNTMFIIGFSIAFPILALSLLSDIIFGMIMKTMPSFNLLVIGFPVKITVALIVIIAILGSIITIFKENFIYYFNMLGNF